MTTGMTRIFAAAVTAALLLSGHASAADKTPLTPGIVEQLNPGSKLTDYGLARHDPLLLLAAARLIASASPEAAAAAAPLAPADLIEKAKAMAKGDTTVEAMADSIADEASRGLCYGPGTVYGCF